MPRYDIVVSAENNTYMVWQAMLFHYSCRRHLGQSPIVMVHKQHEPLLPGFQRIAAAGGAVQTAPNYRRLGGVNYPPRNTAATLRHVQSDADYLILCDPDMIFLRPVSFQDHALASRQVSFDRVTYLDPNLWPHQPTLDEVCRRAGVPAGRLRDLPISGGVPHIIPRELQPQLSTAWLQCLELFPTVGPWSPEIAGAPSRECHLGPQQEWLATMWAIVLAVHRLGLEPVTTQFCISNHADAEPLPPIESSGPSILHYCYPAAGFNKHLFDSASAAESLVWNVPLDDGTISGAIGRQLHEARDFYGLGAAGESWNRH